MSGSIAPIHDFTASSHGAVASVAAVVSIACLLTITAARAWIAYGQRLRIQKDDVLFASALVCAIAHGACVERQVDVGLGKHWTELSSPDQIAFLKLVYAGELVAIFAMAFAKISVTLLYQKIAPFENVCHYRLLFVVVGVWAVFSAFAQAFACGLPQPWLHLPSDCSAQFSLDYAIIFLNALTDVVLVLVFLPILWKLNTGRKRRITTMILFASRSIVSATAIGQLVVVALMPKNLDPSWFMIPKTMMDLIVTSLSVITACLPRINRFLNDLHTGQLDAAINDRVLNEHPTMSKSTKSSKLPFLHALPNILSTSTGGSESSLMPQHNSKRSRDTNTDSSAVTNDEMPRSVPLSLRTPSERMHTCGARWNHEDTLGSRTG